MTKVNARIRAMDDFQVVRYFETFSRHLLAGSSTSFDEVKNGIDASTRAVAGWNKVESLTPQQAKQLLPPAEAASTARNILLHLADDATFGPLLEEHLASYRDDELMVEMVLAVGLVASVLMVVASTEFEGKIAGVKFKKGKVDPETLKALIGPFAAALTGRLTS
jgi:hypothetical protein